MCVPHFYETKCSIMQSLSDCVVCCVCFALLVESQIVAIILRRVKDLAELRPKNNILTSSGITVLRLSTFEFLWYKTQY